MAGYPREASQAEQIRSLQEQVRRLRTRVPPAAVSGGGHTPSFAQASYVDASTGGTHDMFWGGLSAVGSLVVTIDGTGRLVLPGSVSDLWLLVHSISVTCAIDTVNDLAVVIQSHAGSTMVPAELDGPNGPTAKFLGSEIRSGGGIITGHYVHAHSEPSGFERDFSWSASVQCVYLGTL